MSVEQKTVHIFKAMEVSDFIEVGVIIVLSIALITAFQHSFRWLGARLHGQRKLTLLALVPFVRLFIIVMAIIRIVPLVIEPSFQNMIALLSAIGFGLAFALKDYASSLIAGIVAIGERNYRNGDWIKVGDIYGEVYNVGMRTIEIITPDDDRVLIPHALLWNKPVMNANNGNSRLMCVADFYLEARHDARKAVALLEDVALTSAYLYANSPIKVIVVEKPWGTHYRLKAYPVNSGQQFTFVSDLTVRGKAALTQRGFDFARLSQAVLEA